ncbi:MAG: uroporphyrinogen decarboxylase family protein [Thermodesulfobacteriota bacterium]
MKDNPTERVEKTIQGQAVDRVARGEVWINSLVLEQHGFPDDLPGQIRFREGLGMDVLAMPLDHRPGFDESQGYRCFSPADLAMARQITALFPMPVMDGPWQRLTRETGLMATLEWWGRNRAGLEEELKITTEYILGTIQACSQAGPGLMVLADDLAGGTGPLFSPAWAGEVLGPLYGKIIQAARSVGARPLFHSCGDISRLLPIIGAAGFEGLAACQTTDLDMEGAAGQLGIRPLIVGGLEPDWLENEMKPDIQESIKTKVAHLAEAGRLMLASSTGLYQAGQVDRLKKIYATAVG